jgi:hypothetical protein
MVSVPLVQWGPVAETADLRFALTVATWVTRGVHENFVDVLPLVSVVAEADVDAIF